MYTWKCTNQSSLAIQRDSGNFHLKYGVAQFQRERETFGARERCVYLGKLTWHSLRARAGAGSFWYLSADVSASKLGLRASSALSRTNLLT